MNFDREDFLFDLDGTLINSSHCHEQAWVEALEACIPGLGRSFDYDRFKGMRTLDVLRVLCVTPKARAEAAGKMKQALYLTGVEAGRVELIPGAAELIETLRGRRRRLFLVTGASRRSTTAILRRFGWANVFSAVVTGDDVTRSKPSPDCYARCVSQCGVSRDRAIVVEDSAAGYESARAAGLEVALVNNEGLAHLPEYVGTLQRICDHICGGSS